MALLRPPRDDDDDDDDAAAQRLGSSQYFDAVAGRSTSDVLPDNEDVDEDRFMMSVDDELPSFSVPAAGLAPTHSTSTSTSRETTLRPATTTTTKMTTTRATTPVAMPPSSSATNPVVPPTIHSHDEIPALFASRPYIEVTVDGATVRDDDHDDDGEDSAVDDDSGDEAEGERDASERHLPTHGETQPQTSRRGNGRAHTRTLSATSSEAAATSRTRRKRRLASLDVFRGVVVLLMILANAQVPGAYPFMIHAEWIGLTPVDLIFPSFLFVMGAAIPLSFQNRQRSMYNVSLRALKLFGLGLLLNDPISALFTTGLSQFRIMGVLQRLAIAYHVCSLAYLYLSWLAFQTVFPATLLISWILITYTTLVPKVDPSTNEPCLRGSFAPPICTAQSRWDLVLLGGKGHTYRHDVFDNEGTVSTLTATLSCFVGVLVGVALLRAVKPDRSDGEWRRRMAVGLAVGGMMCLASGVLVERLGIPISKILWTPSFVLIAAGASLCGLALCFHLLDVPPRDADEDNMARPLRGHEYAGYGSVIGGVGRATQSPSSTPNGSPIRSQDTSPRRQHRRRQSQEEHLRLPRPPRYGAMITAFFAASGKNPLLLYILSDVVLLLLWYGRWDGKPLAIFVVDLLFGWCLPPNAASLVWGLGLALMFGLVGAGFDRIGWYWTV